MKPILWLEKHNTLAWCLTIFAAVTIFVMSQLVFHVGDGNVGTRTMNVLPIAYHFMAFFCLTLFLTISWTKGELNFKIFAICFLLVTIYALTDEIHQFFVPGRFMSVQDIRVDLLGIGVAQIFYALHLKKSLLQNE